MQFLVFQLQAPLASWGDVAVGEYRGSREYPGESALIGLLAAALGIERDDAAGQQQLQRDYRFAVGVLSTGQLLRDYHTAQVPGRAQLTGRPHATRRDELAVPKDRLNTILSTRDYRQGASCIVAVQAQGDQAAALSILADALKRPRFVLYLGRKSCPPAAPLDPQVLDAESAHAAMQAYLARNEDAAVLSRVVWSDGIDSGLTPTFSAPRKDKVIRRQHWLFADRTEHVHLFAEGE